MKDGRHTTGTYRHRAGQPPEEPADPLRLVIHRGMFSTRDTRRAQRQGDTHLIDGPLLRRWAQGTPLRELTGVM
jgi:hypothetical protein